MYAEIIEVTETTVTFANENARISTIDRALVCEKYATLEVGYMEIDPKDTDADNEFIQAAFFGGWVNNEPSWKSAQSDASAEYMKYKFGR